MKALAYLFYVVFGHHWYYYNKNNRYCECCHRHELSDGNGNWMAVYQGTENNHWE